MKKFLENSKKLKVKHSDEELGDYFLIPYYSSSKMKIYEENPALYRGMFGVEGETHEYERQETKAKTLGALVHKAILEPEKFKEGEPYYKAMLTPKEREVFGSIVSHIRCNDTAKSILNKVQFFEKVFIWKEKLINDKREENVRCKMKVDIYTSNGYLVDVKTIASLGSVKNCYYKVVRACMDYRYDLQMSFYKRGLEKNGLNVRGVLLIFLEKAPPFEVVVFLVNEDFLIGGEEGNLEKGVRGWKEILTEMHFNPRKSRFEEGINELNF